jgi:RNA polymerase sigma-70 factor (ECF subfamily)
MQGLEAYRENEVFEKWRLSTGLEREQLLKELVPLLQSHAYSVCWQKAPDHRDEFEGVINESIFRAITKAKDFRGDSKFGSWFHRIVINECNRLLKRKQDNPEESLEALTEELGKETNPEKAILLRELVEGLGEEDKGLLELELGGYSAAEIGIKLGISEGAAEVRWSRLKEKIRGRL